MPQRKARSKGIRIQRFDNALLMDFVVHVVEMNARNIENEDRKAEQAILFFLSVSAGSIGLLSLLEKFQPIMVTVGAGVTVVVLSILFLYGLVTLNRHIWRSVYIRGYQDHIMSAFKHLAAVNPICQEQLVIQQRHEREWQPSKSSYWKLRGATAEFIYLTNSLLAGGIAMTLCSPLINVPWVVGLVSIIVAFAVGYILHRISVKILKRVTPQATDEASAS